MLDLINLIFEFSYQNKELNLKSGTALCLKKNSNSHLGKYVDLLFFVHFYHFQVSSAVQSDSQRVFVQQKYPPDKLYKVTTSYTAADLMDISVIEGVCVGLIVDKDPMGNKNRWFVDDGGMYDILRNYGKFSLDFYTVVPLL
jgi:hypothetical protein